MLITQVPSALTVLWDITFEKIYYLTFMDQSYYVTLFVDNWCYRCPHIERALSATAFAPKTQVAVSSMDGLTEDQSRLLNLHSKDGILELFSLPGGNICVPLLPEENKASAIGFTHVMNGKVNFAYNKCDQKLYYLTPSNSIYQYDYLSKQLEPRPTHVTFLITYSQLSVPRKQVPSRRCQGPQSIAEEQQVLHPYLSYLEGWFGNRRGT